ncbi:MAG: hypothetical protein ACRC0G_07075 [Fusobacteriaceae bacterium]
MGQVYKGGTLADKTTPTITPISQGLVCFSFKYVYNLYAYKNIISEIFGVGIQMYNCSIVKIDENSMNNIHGKASTPYVTGVLETIGIAISIVASSDVHLVNNFIFNNKNFLYTADSPLQPYANAGVYVDHDKNNNEVPTASIYVIKKCFGLSIDKNTIQGYCNAIRILSEHISYSIYDNFIDKCIYSVSDCSVYTGVISTCSICNNEIYAGTISVEPHPIGSNICRDSLTFSGNKIYDMDIDDSVYLNSYRLAVIIGRCNVVLFSGNRIYDTNTYMHYVRDVIVSENLFYNTVYTDQSNLSLSNSGKVSIEKNNFRSPVNRTIQDRTYARSINVDSDETVISDNYFENSASIESRCKKILVSDNFFKDETLGDNGAANNGIVANFINFTQYYSGQATVCRNTLKIKNESSVFPIIQVSGTFNLFDFHDNLVETKKPVVISVKGTESVIDCSISGNTLVSTATSTTLYRHLYASVATAHTQFSSIRGNITRKVDNVVDAHVNAHPSKYTVIENNTGIIKYNRVNSAVNSIIVEKQYTVGEWWPTYIAGKFGKICTVGGEHKADGTGPARFQDMRIY